jgi:hypothetical protein
MKENDVKVTTMLLHIANHKKNEDTETQSEK